MRCFYVSGNGIRPGLQVWTDWDCHKFVSLGEEIGPLQERVYLCAINGPEILGEMIYFAQPTMGSDGYFLENCPKESDSAVLVRINTDGNGEGLGSGVWVPLSGNPTQIATGSGPDWVDALIVLHKDDQVVINSRRSNIPFILSYEENEESGIYVLKTKDV